MFTSVEGFVKSQGFAVVISFVYCNKIVLLYYLTTKAKTEIYVKDNY